MPLKISRVTKSGAIALPNNQVFEAYAYVERLAIPIATTNIGADFVSKQANTAGANVDDRKVTNKIPTRQFEKGSAGASARFRSFRGWIPIFCVPRAAPCTRLPRAMSLSMSGRITSSLLPASGSKRSSRNKP